MRLCTWLVLTLGTGLEQRGMVTEAVRVGADKAAVEALGLEAGLGMVFGYCLAALMMLSAKASSTRSCTHATRIKTEQC